MCPLFLKLGIFLNNLFHFMNKISTYYHAFIIKIKNEIQIALSDHFVRRFHIFLHKHVPKKENQNYQNVYSRYVIITFANWLISKLRALMI